MIEVKITPAKYQLQETRLQEKLDNETTRCNLCLWRCKLKHGQRGFCQAHVNRMVLYIIYPMALSQQ